MAPKKKRVVADASDDGASDLACSASAAAAVEAGLAEERGRKRGPTMCAACKRRPEATEWASYRPRGEQQIPTGDKCNQCFKVYEAGFIHISWEEFCSRLHNPAKTQEPWDMNESLTDYRVLKFLPC